ncbi:MAG TPA: 30S ribosomal protein S20 [Candidatus Binataceae bacterium]|nr:30S ribosomal protein S20 [Candidatus Binataceae bacterium]
MPHIPVHPSAEKRNRQNLKRRDRNRAIRSRVHSAVKDALEAIAGTDAAAAAAQLRQATRVLYKAAGKGTVHRNTAARKVARLSRALHRTHAGAKA